MSPIKGVSDVVRLPRLGKIRLGIKKETENGTPYPSPTDYFVCPAEVRKVFGEKPRELRIMFPTDDQLQWASQYLRCYSTSRGLICRGDGETAVARIDVKTGEIAARDAEATELREVICSPHSCTYYQRGQCRRVMNLQFLLPEVPGLGVWQIDTSSFYSIININSMIRMLKGILGRCSMIPLTLALGPIEVSPPGQSKKTVHVMHIKKDIRLVDLARLALLPPAQVLIPEPEIEEPPEDLFPHEALEEAESEEEPKEDKALQIPADERLVLWNNIRSLLKWLDVNDDQIASWFFQHFLVAASRQTFEDDMPPKEMTRDILNQFHNSLLAFEANLEIKRKAGKEKRDT